MPKTDEKASKSYSDTVHLPKTDFPMRGNLGTREPQWQEFWEKNNIFKLGFTTDMLVG